MAKQPNRKKNNPKHKKKTSKGGGLDEPFYQGVPRKRNSPKVQAKQQRRKVDPEEKKEVHRQERDPKRRATGLRPDEAIRLNRFIAQAGVCSRREADTLISTGKIKVNGEVITDMSTRVVPERDKVEYRGRILTPQNFVYFLFNKPKNMITTMSDPLGRKTVLQAIENISKQRVYPVGRLDRNTTGLLLLTNDGELAKQLTHPSYEVKKIYKIRLNRLVEEEHLEDLRRGIVLEDGPAKVDRVDWVDGIPGKEVGLEIHSGRNRIVRRMFEHFGYQVEALDRVMIGHLDKKGLPRGKWRKLSDKEIGFLKMMAGRKEKKD